MHVDPVFVTSITRADGTILYEAEHHQQRVLDPDVADQVTAVLEQVVAAGHRHRGPARPARRRQDRHRRRRWRNAWFCGYVPQLATAVWVGFPAASSSR